MTDRTFKLELHNNHTNFKVSDVVINQGNTDSITFRYKVFDKGNEIDYTQFTEARATFAPRNGKAIAAVTCDIQDSGISCIVPNEAFRRTGIINGQLDLTFDGGVLTTNYFMFSVIPTLASLSGSDSRFFMDEIDKFLKMVEELRALQEYWAELIESLEGQTVTGGQAAAMTLESHSQASVEVERVGNILHFIFGIPRGPRGFQGEEGPEGAGIHLLDVFDSMEDLLIAHPTGERGDAYLVDGGLAIWSERIQGWLNAGTLIGAAIPIEDSLESDSPYYALSARQGKVLDERINGVEGNINTLNQSKEPAQTPNDPPRSRRRNINRYPKCERANTAHCRQCRNTGFPAV